MEWCQQKGWVRKYFPVVTEGFQDQEFETTHQTAQK
jgi:hypothetical protein